MADQTSGGGDDVTVEVAGRSITLDDGDRVVIGRDNGLDVIGLDSTDVGLSRKHLGIEVNGGRCVISNLSTKRPLHLERSGVAGQETVPPGGEETAWAPTRVLLPGRNNVHAVNVIPGARAQAAANSVRSGEATVDYRQFFNDDDRKALTALFEGYLLPHPRYDPTPRTYGQAAARIGGGMKESTVRKRIENLRTRLKQADVLYADDKQALYTLASFVIDNSIIGPAELNELERR